MFGLGVAVFAYNEEPVEDISSGLDIERFGMQSLLRALSIGRVIAFSGSGSSVSFGQPAWDDIKQSAANEFYLLFHGLEGHVDKLKKKRQNSKTPDTVDLHIRTNFVS